MTAYIERANGRWEAWTWADGDRYFLGHGYDLSAFVGKLKREGYDHFIRI
jgi:hypothetical protein